jgi:anti-sigma B factor antagonist
MELLYVSRENGITVVTPSIHRLDASVAPAFKQAVVALIEANERRLVINVAGVGFLDSTGLGALVSILKALGGNGAMAVCGASGEVLALFKLTRMEKVFTLFATRAEAVAGIGGRRAG